MLNILLLVISVILIVIAVFSIKNVYRKKEKILFWGLVSFGICLLALFMLMINIKSKNKDNLLVKDEAIVESPSIKTLNVGISNYTSIHVDGLELTGIEAEVLAEIFKDAGFDINPILLGDVDYEEALDSSMVDVVIGISQDTMDQNTDILFTIPYLTLTPVVLYSKESQNFDNKSFKDLLSSLNNKSLGVDISIPNYKDGIEPELRITKALIQTYNSSFDLLSDFNKKILDVVITTDIAVQSFQIYSGIDTLVPISYVDSSSYPVALSQFNLVIKGKDTEIIYALNNSIFNLKLSE